MSDTRTITPNDPDQPIGDGQEQPAPQGQPPTGAIVGSAVVRRRDIGFGIHVTESADEVFIHFKNPSGCAMGFRVDPSSGIDILGRDTLHQWAMAILNHESFTHLE